MRILIHPTREVSPGGKSAPQRQKLHTDNVKQRLRNKSGIVVMGFQMQICLILCFSWSTMGKVCVQLRNTDAVSKEEYIRNEVNSSRLRPSLHLTFMAFCLLFIIWKQ